MSRRKRMHGRRRVCRSPFKIGDAPEGSIFSGNNESILGNNTMTKEEYMAKQKKPTGINEKIVGGIVDFVTPKTAVEAVPVGGIASKVFKGAGGKVASKVANWAQGLFG